MQLILFTTPNFLPHETETVNRMFNAGLQTLHLRKPDTDAAALRQYLQQIQPQHLSRVMLHQHHELAAEYPLKGIHYRERDRPSPPLARVSQSLCQSTSLHAISDLLLDWQNLDYAFLSPIFNSISKDGYVAASFNLAELQQALSQACMPVYALGGITSDRLPAVKRLGFAGVGVLGSVWQSIDPVNALADFLAVMND